ncbi:hypothetical protein SK571_32435 [Lentzea sp. BCCO 10_0798]|uniref:Uncharacterized protein n=1 Tax=Lentzea kristufekii TaxID=3095430 RepID=A0ABU4U194_9PSEU|nr:hypothetical protein [Lentzea sp. BCCO 10_0798]MDX8054103.1 hypothetical protein [Lentzea sp. BCCO 10_0798]
MTWGGTTMHPSDRELAVIPLGDPRNVATITAPIGAPDGLLALGRNRVMLVDNTAANRVVEARTRDHWRPQRRVRAPKGLMWSVWNCCTCATSSRWPRN